MWYLATNEVDVFHYGELQDGFVLTTGQPTVLYFSSQSELEAELAKYGQAYTNQVMENELPPEAPEN